ncbi:MAG: recombinase family protein [Oscillospiraceae bacterium]|nr:recombinase family protein [Oscillospiraceae bacterium]
MAAAIYARQSIDKKDSISIETQIELCRAGIDCEDIKVYSDKGYSGSNTNRPGFQELIKNIKSGLIDKVYVYKLDRISRSLADFVDIMEMFDTYGCEFSSRSESFDTSTPFGRAMLQICMVFAQLERENTIQRVRDAYSTRSKEGFYMGGRVPYGFSLKQTTLNGKRTSMYEPVPEEAEQLKLIFDLYSQPEMTLGSVIKQLQHDGITNLRGAKWQTSTLGDILRNPCYVKSDAEVYRFFSNKGAILVNDIEEFDGRGGFMFGRRAHGKKFSNFEAQTLVIALHQGIIEPDVWLKCQYKLARNKQIKRTGIGKNTWLSGLVRCGKCGNIMKLTKSNTKAGRYFNCIGRISLHICDGHNSTVYADAIETLVAGEIEQKLRETEFRSGEISAANAKEINALNIQLSEIEKEIEQLLDKLSECNEILLKYINKRVSELDAKKREIENEIGEKRLNSNDKTDILELAKIWEKDNFDTKKLIAGTLIKTVKITDNEIEIEWKI